MVLARIISFVGTCGLGAFIILASSPHNERPKREEEEEREKGTERGTEKKRKCSAQLLTTTSPIGRCACDLTGNAENGVPRRSQNNESHSLALQMLVARPYRKQKKMREK